MRRIGLIGLLFFLIGCGFSKPLPKKLTFIPADATASLDPAAVELSCSVFKKRLASQDGLDFAVDCGPDTIEVALAENADERAITSLLTATGLIEFIDPQGEYMAEGSAVCTTTYPRLPKTSEFSGDTCKTTYQTIANSIDFDLSALEVTTDSTGNKGLTFEFVGQSASAIEAFTADNFGKPMSIVVDQRVLSSPQINGTLPGEGIITFGNSSRVEQEKEAKQLLSALESGPLPMGWELQE